MKRTHEATPSEAGRQRALIEAARIIAEEAPTTAAQPDAVETLAPAARGDGRSPAAVHAAGGGDAFAGYEITRELGRGGQGVVLEAVQLDTKRKVAIKVLLEGALADTPTRRRFEREIELAAQLQHPHIVTVYHSGVSAHGRPFFVMDYVRGRSLRKFVRDNEMDLRAMLALYAKVCDAVQFAHQRGVIHRDLKPSNILVDDDGNPKVMDFGLAKSLGATAEAQLSMTEQVLGTLPYMSPEQAAGRNHDVDVRTDVYALGVILYELLTGQYPYAVVGQVADVLRNISQAPPERPAQVWSPDSGVRSRAARGTAWRRRACPIDMDIETIVLRALAKERDRRYQSAGELGRDVQRYLSNEMIEARRDSAWYVLRTYVRMNWKTSLVAACVIAISSASGWIAWWQYGLLGAAQDDAREQQRQAARVSMDNSAMLELVARGQRREALLAFLWQWEAGDEVAARKIRDSISGGDGLERRLMEFALDGTGDAEALLGETTRSQDRGIACFIVGLRRAKEGQASAARALLEDAVMSTGISPALRAAARAALERATAQNRGNDR